MDSVDSTPTGDMIIRFTDTIVSHIKPKQIAKHAPSKNTVSSGIMALIDTLVFRYADFKISKHNSKN
jgi:hypothetical protein